jgi:hypothetical protein
MAELLISKGDTTSTSALSIPSKPGSRRRLVACLSVLFAVVGVLACDPPTGGVAQGSIAGVVVKGPVGKATVTAFTVDAHGRKGSAVGTASTADDGTFVVQVGSQSGPTLLCATGGTYTEESTGGLVRLGNDGLCALLDDQQVGRATTGLIVTPFTSMHAALTGCLLQSSRESPVAVASTRASTRINDFLSADGGVVDFNFRTTSIFDVTAGRAPSFTADAWHGLLLAGLSESARQLSIASGLDPGVKVTSATLAAALVSDLDDGACVFDGKDQSGTTLTQGTIPLTANTLRGAPQGLAQSINLFVADARNASGIHASDITCTRRSESEPVAGLNVSHPNAERIAPLGDAPDGPSRSHSSRSHRPRPFTPMGITDLQGRAQHRRRLRRRARHAGQAQGEREAVAQADSDAGGVAKARR